MNAPLLHKRAAMYLRSSKDRSDLSIAVQRNQLTEFAEQNGYILNPDHEFSDVVESGQDDDRPGFQSLLRAVHNRNRGWTVLLVLDTSRLARNVALAQFFEKECAKRNIEVVYKMLPTGGDPVMESLLRIMLQGFDQFHSDISRAKSVAGLRENIAQGYRAGGPAPTGYQRQILKKDTIRAGKNVTKAKLIIDPETAPMVQAFLKARLQGRSRPSIKAELNLPFADSTLHKIEKNALTYAGHTVWNRIHELPFNKREFREREEWVIERNTHPALITDAEAEQLLTNMEKYKTTRHRFGYKDKYLLAGLLKSPEGFVWHGKTCTYRIDGSMIPYYRVKYTKPGEDGLKQRTVRANELEEAVLEQITQDITTGILVKKIVTEARKGQVTKENEKQVRNSIRSMDSQIKKLAEQISETLDLAVLFKDKAKKVALVEKIEDLEGQREKLVAEKERLEAGLLATTVGGESGKVTEAKARAYGSKLLRVLESDREENRASMKESLRLFISEIILDPITLEFTIVYKFFTDDDDLDNSNIDPWVCERNVSVLSRGLLPA